MVRRASEALAIASRDLPVGHEEILGQLDRILDSVAFDASVRNRNFLRYVVEETVAGRAGYIKGYTVAQSVFGRGTDFDPQLDPVVRIEASRLRRSLEHYYLTAGRSDVIRIELPKGGYVPHFALSTDNNDASSTSVLASSADSELPSGSRPIRGRGPSIVVLPFQNLGGELNGDLLAQRITEELIGRLLAYRELKVISANTSFKLAATGDAETIGRRLALGYVLKGSVRIADARIRIALQLLDVENGEYLWAERFDRDLTSNDLWAAQEEVAAEVATRIGAPYGAIARVSQELLARRSQGGVDDYLALLTAYGYRRQQTPITHSEVRTCLEQTVAQSPTSVEVWAHLALVYIDEYRFGLNPQPNPLGRALAAAEEAVRWGGDNALAHLALSLVHHYRRDHDGAYAAARHAVALNPDNPEVLAQAAARFVLSGAWGEGMPLLQRAMSRDPDPPPWNYILLTLDSLRRRDYRAALNFADAASSSRLPHVVILQCAIQAALGEQERAIAAFNVACAQGRDFNDLWEQICRSIHDDDLLKTIETWVQRARSRKERASSVGRARRKSPAEGKAPAPRDRGCRLH